MTDFLQDIRYAFRTFGRTAGLTVVIVASLAIGIGANTAVFSVVNALLLEPLPYPDPGRLTVLWLRSPGVNIPQDWPAPGQYLAVENENRSFAGLSISLGRTGTLIGRGGEAPFPEPLRVEALLTSSSLFHLLGAKARYGRLLLPDEDSPGKAPVVVLSNAFWKRAFNGDPSIVGRTIVLNGFSAQRDSTHQFQVVGVLGPEFLLNAEIMPTVAGTRQMDLFLPLPLGADAANRRSDKDENYNVMARLKPGVTLAQARADVAAIAARIRDEDKRDRSFTIDVVPLVESVVGNVRAVLLIVMGSVTLVLLIACANVASLLLTRATARQKEIAVRVALGARWQRLVRQLLTETTLLGLMGGAAGVVVAALALGAVRAVNPGNIPRLDAIHLDGRVLAFTSAVSVLTGILFGLAPALRAARVDLNSTLRAGGRDSRGDGGLGGGVGLRRPLRTVLVVAEIAISIVLLVGAGLLIRSFVRLQHVSPGFDPAGVVSMRLGAPARRFENRDALVAYYATLGEQLASVPGVKERGAVSTLPFTSSVGWGIINVEGWTPEPGQELQVDQRSASPTYFSTMRMPLLAGRSFDDGDLPQNAAPVVIIDDKFAKRFWPHESAIGKHLWYDPARKLTIVGVVGSVKQYGLDVDGRIVVYQPSPGGSYQVARTSGDPATVAGALMRKVHEFDPTVTVFDVRTMSDRLSASMARQRFATTMLGAFAAFALVLAVVGVYGVMSHLVAQGTRDIGVRMALGAERSGILLMVLRQGMELALTGVLAGLLGAVALTRLMASLLFGVSATDVVTFSIVPLMLIATAMLAIYVPALRATRVDPTVALREE